MKYLPTAFLFILFASSCSSASSSQKPEAAPSPDAVSMEASEAIAFPLTAKDKKKLLADFKKANANEQRALNRSEKSAMKSFVQIQAKEKRNWNESEKKARHVFFDQHMSGPERRQYIQEFLKRKEAFDQKQKSNLAALKESWKEKQDNLKSIQKDRETQFNAKLNANQRPDSSLWPKE